MENGALEAKVLRATQARIGESWEDAVGWGCSSPGGCSEEPEGYGWETREVQDGGPVGPGLKDG